MKRQTDEAEIASRIQPDDKLLSPRSAGEKFDRSTAWVWEQLNKNASFPRPIYKDGFCFFIDRELADYIARTFTDSRNDKTSRAARFAAGDLSAEKIKAYRERGKAAA